jgi:hypothetical protein
MKSNVKYLGLFIDSNLTWKAHIDYISIKIYRAVGIIARLRHFVPKHTLQRIYHAMLHPYLNYGISVWGQACKTHLHHLLVSSRNGLFDWWILQSLENTLYRFSVLPEYFQLTFCTFTMLFNAWHYKWNGAHQHCSLLLVKVTTIIHDQCLDLSVFFPVSSLLFSQQYKQNYRGFKIQNVSESNKE